MITGLGVALGIGLMVIAGELHLESNFDRDFGQLFVGAGFIFWGIAMFVFGVVGVVKTFTGERKPKLTNKCYGDVTPIIWKPLKLRR